MREHKLTGEDQAALTPPHVLRGREGGEKPSGAAILRSCLSQNGHKRVRELLVLFICRFSLDKITLHYARTLLYLRSARLAAHYARPYIARIYN